MYKRQAQVLAQVAQEGRSKASHGQTPYHWAAAYWVAAAVIALLGKYGTVPTRERAEEPQAI